MKVWTKIGIFLLTVLLLIPFTSAAQTQYVSEDLTITLRTGPGTDRKIIAFPKSGTPLEVIAPGDEYTEVRMSNGKQGWVLTRFLTSKVPAYMVLDQLQKKHARLSEQYQALKEQSGELNSESKGLAEDLAATRQALEKLTAEHEALIKESADFLDLKARYEKAVKEAADAREKSDKLEGELGSQFNTGLLYGGGLIILGFIAGFVLKKPKRRSPLLS